MPELAQKCIETWEKFCPDYEIKRWDESNFDINSCDYVREAYEAKKWAFVSDYARYKILYENGGLYFDTDVELIKSIDDIAKNGPFLGCETMLLSHPAINPGLGMGTETQLPIYREILDAYEGVHFLKSDGTPDLTTVVDRTTAIFEKHGFVPADVPQKVADVMVYPPRYFSPLDMATGLMNVVEDTRSIHHYDGSWVGDTETHGKELRWELCQKHGKTIGQILWVVSYSAYILRHDGFGVFWEKVKKKLKR